jgi:hypothetical protein
MSVTWSDEIEAVFSTDLTVALGYRTPAGGVVVQAVAPVGLQDRERGTLTFTTSLGFSKKLERIASDPRVAMAFHAREHGRGSTTEYVLAQGVARVNETPSDADRARVRDNAALYLGPAKEGVFWNRWLREYYVSRVPVVVSVARILSWPTLEATGSPRLVAGDALPDGDAAAQRAPKLGTAARIDVARAVQRLRATRHLLLGFAGTDSFPVVVPVQIDGHDAAGFTLTSAAPLPRGGRRAGVLGHSYGPQLVGLETRQYTGWLEVGDDGNARYAPHTETGYKAPANKTLMMLLNGALAKRGVRAARRAACARAR